MANGAERPSIFISYSHKDEPDPAFHPNAERWLTFVTSHLGPSVAHGHLELWDDRSIEGGGDWKKEIDDALSQCAVCILLVSRHSLTSRFILDVEMKKILQRHHARGGHLFPIVITACDVDAAKWLIELNLRPRDGTALELYAEAQRNAVMSALSREIRKLVGDYSSAVPAVLDNSPSPTIEVTRLPETAYKRLVGRDSELKLLDEAWTGSDTSILSLIAWGGAGKTTLVSEWLTRLQKQGYPGADVVLAWSFYDQGTKERATSADLFLEWALRMLGHIDPPQEAISKGNLLSEELSQKRVLLILDGVEPLQFGPGPQEGLLKDAGLRTFLRRFSTEPPNAVDSMVVVTSRLAIKDLRREATRFGSAPVCQLEKLSDEAGGRLLADNEVTGPEDEFLKASKEFGGHALALSLLAGFLVRRHGGDIRKRVLVGPLLAAESRNFDEQVHGHAKRVMTSIESEWLRDQPILKSIMWLVSLFDRPARVEFLDALRSDPPIEGVTELIVQLSDREWMDAISDLRSVRLLSPTDPRSPGDLDAHPLIRDWFGSNFEKEQKKGWQAGHARLYQKLKQTTEGEAPNLTELEPLYQAIRHGCHAGYYRDALREVYFKRIARTTSTGQPFYSLSKLGARSTDLAVLSYFFEQPYDRISKSLTDSERWSLLNSVGSILFNLGRVREASRIYEQVFKTAHNLTASNSRADVASQLVYIRQILGDVAGAQKALNTGMTWAKQKSRDIDDLVHMYVIQAILQTHQNKLSEAFASLDQAAKLSGWSRLSERAKNGYLLSESFLMLELQRYAQAKSNLGRLANDDGIGTTANAALVLARADLGLALNHPDEMNDHLLKNLYTKFDHAIRTNIKAENVRTLAYCYLGRSMLDIAAGNWAASARDLAEAEDIASFGHIMPIVIDVALLRARSALCRAFAHSRFQNLQNCVQVSETETSALHELAKRQLDFAEKEIATSGYKLRSAELDELRKILEGEKRVEDLPFGG